jgi:predicted nucleotidyltransferase
MAKKPKKPKIHADERGHFVWENFFVRGRQRRRKQRVTVIDGEIINDLDDWLLANADDVFLHQIERWDLIEQRQLEEEGPLTKEQAMKPPPRKLRLDIVELESVFEFGCRVNPDVCDEPCVSFLNLTNGKVVAPEDEEESDALLDDENHLLLPDELFEDLSNFDALEEFVDSLPDDPLRGQLKNAIRGKGAFRRFKDIVFGGGNVELKHRWGWFETRRQRERIVEWLRDENIEPDWGRDIFEVPPLPDKRGDLLRAVLAFVRDARKLPGIRRIALLGSLATPKAIPKDVDLLVEVDDDTPLDKLASLKRQLLGRTLQTGDSCGADVFLCNPRHQYLGRICSWKQCAPGIRRACQARHCGRRAYLYDDLQNVRLDPTLVAKPPLELWPEIFARTEIPDDVQVELVAALR